MLRISFYVTVILIISLFLSCNRADNNLEYVNKNLVYHTKNFIDDLPYQPYYDSLAPKEITLVIEKLELNKYRLGYAQFKDNYSICKKYKYNKAFNLENYTVFVFSDKTVNKLIKLDSIPNCNSGVINKIELENDKFPFRGFDVDSNGIIIDSMASWQWNLPLKKKSK